MGEINEHEFLTQETARGLRLSLQSTMDLCQYLETRYGFKYLLTGKVNQDNLEVKLLNNTLIPCSIHDHIKAAGPICPLFNSRNTKARLEQCSLT